MITEKQLLKALEENFENFNEERGMEPVDGVRKVGHVDSGEVYVY